MIKVNSKVIIKEIKGLHISGKDCPPVMIVEGLYYRNQFGIWNIDHHKSATTKPEYAKCLWYNTKNELQSELISLALLTEL